MDDSIFMKVSDLEGSATTEGFVGQIGIDSLSHGLDLTCYSGGGTEGRTSGVCSHSDISITKDMDKNSIKFNEWCCKAHPIPEIVITVCRQKGDNIEPLIVFTLGDCLVSSYNVSAGGGNPVESITFNYARITWVFTEQDIKGDKLGNVAAGWDLEKNKEIEVKA